ncbi:MAG: hypothetical protein AAFS10_14330 [Myxococcota bacterium]
MHTALYRSLTALAVLAFAAIVSPLPLHAQEEADTDIADMPELSLEDPTLAWNLPGTAQPDLSEPAWVAIVTNPEFQRNVDLLAQAEVDMMIVDINDNVEVDDNDEEPSQEPHNEASDSWTAGVPSDGTLGESQDLKLSDTPSYIYNSEPSNTPRSWLHNDSLDFFCPEQMGWSGF